MSEMKSLTDSFKDKLYTNLLNLLDQKFLEEFLMLPPSDPVLLKRYANRVNRAISHKALTMEQFFSLLPPEFAEKLKAAIIRKVQEQKKKDI